MTATAVYPIAGREMYASLNCSGPTPKPWKRMTKFSDLKLDPKVLKAIDEAGYTVPTPIQAQAIPFALEGRDVLGIAQTGTGKTASFTLPLITRLGRGRARARMPRSLVLAPTRELAAQVAENFDTYAKHTRLTKALLIGGVAFGEQDKLIDRGVDVLIATPGRLLDHFERGKLLLTGVEVMVVDEADRMLDMGFIHDIKRILKILPPKRQNLLFSATFSKEIRNLAKGLVNNPVEISVSPQNSTAEKVSQRIYEVDKKQKPALLVKLLVDHNWGQTLVFTKTKHGANKLTKYLEEGGFKAAAIHGNKSQGARTKALAGFKDGSIQLLVATDIAARGLDIDQLPQVVNYELPNVAEDYVHRIGRTGRAGASGEAVSLVEPEELKLLAAIERLIKQKLPREQTAPKKAAPQRRRRPAPRKPVATS